VTGAVSGVGTAATTLGGVPAGGGADPVAGAASFGRAEPGEPRWRVGQEDRGWAGAVWSLCRPVGPAAGVRGARLFDTAFAAAVYCPA
jgi:hypothetical protein